MSCTNRPSGTDSIDGLGDVGEPGSIDRFTVEASEDKRAVEVSIASGSSVICGGLVEEVGSESVDGFSMSTAIIVDSLRVLPLSCIDGALHGWCVKEEAGD